MSNRWQNMDSTPGEIISLVDAPIKKPVTQEAPIGREKGMATVLPLLTGSTIHAYALHYLQHHTHRPLRKERKVNGVETQTFEGWLDEYRPEAIDYMRNAAQKLCEAVESELGSEEKHFFFSELTSTVPARISRGISEALRDDAYIDFAVKLFNVRGFGEICKTIAKTKDKEMVNAIQTTLTKMQDEIQESIATDTTQNPEELKERLHHLKLTELLVQGLAYHNVYTVYELDTLDSINIEVQQKAKRLELSTKIKYVAAFTSRFDDLVISTDDTTVEEALLSLGKIREKSGLNLLNLKPEAQKHIETVVEGINNGKAHLTSIEIKTLPKSEGFADTKILKAELTHQALTLQHTLLNLEKQGAEERLGYLLPVKSLLHAVHKGNIRMLAVEMTTPILEPLESTTSEEHSSEVAEITGESSQNQDTIRRNRQLWRFKDNLQEYPNIDNIRITQLAQRDLIRSAYEGHKDRLTTIRNTGNTRDFR